MHVSSGSSEEIAIIYKLLKLFWHQFNDDVK